MPILPSGLRFVFNLRPFGNLLEKVRAELRSGGPLMSMPEFLQIRAADDLRRYVGILWMVPEVADMRTPPEFAHHLKKLPPGWCIVDSGGTFDCLPECLSAKDRHALSRLWSFLSDRPAMTRMLNIVHAHHTRMSQSAFDHHRLVASWFPRAHQSGDGSPVEGAES